MPFPTYTTAETAGGKVDVKLLHTQIAEDPAITTAFLGIDRTSDFFTLLFETSPSEAEQTRCTEIVASHETLEAHKNNLNNQIIRARNVRLETTVLAEYPQDSGKFWSCGNQSQSDWSSLVSLNTLELVEYPFRAYTYDERDHYDIAGSSDLAAIVAAVSLSVLTERATAQSFIDNVLAAATEAEADTAAAGYLEN